MVPHEDEGDESGRPEARAHGHQRLIQGQPVGNYRASAASGRRLGGRASRARALRTTAGSVVVHIGGRLALRKPP